MGANIRALEAIGGVPNLLGRDNTKVAVIKACLYEPQVKAGIGSWLSFYITRSGSIRAWATARRAKPTKQNARGYVDDRLRRPAAPSPTSPPAQQPTTGLILTREKVEAMP